VKKRIPQRLVNYKRGYAVTLLGLFGILLAAAIGGAFRHSEGPLVGNHSMGDWAAMLSSADTNTSARAMNDIQQMGTNGIPLLIRLDEHLSHSRLRVYKKRIGAWLSSRFFKFEFSSPQERFEVNYFKLLSAFRSWNIPILIELMAKGGHDRALEILGNMGDAPVPELVQLLQMTNAPCLRVQVAMTLGNIVNRFAHDDWSVAVQALVRCLKDPDASVRITAAMILAGRRTTCELTIPVFIDAVTNEDNRIRAIADFGLTNTIPRTRTGAGSSILFSGTHRKQ
jgi:hypothetical protein